MSESPADQMERERREVCDAMHASHNPGRTHNAWGTPLPDVARVMEAQDRLQDAIADPFDGVPHGVEVERHIAPHPSVASGEGWERGNGDAAGTGKQSNPKDIVGSTKLSLFIVPDTLAICAAMGFLEGALKYGRFNWRIAGIRASIYIDALERHIKKWKNGQDYDKLTTVHHLDNAIACLGIMRDAMLYGKLDDDRPPCPDPDAMADLIDAQGKTIAHLKATFASHTPYQFTIKDTPR